MIGLDTNVLVRLLTTADLEQHGVAVRFIAERTRADPAFVSFVVLAETVWVLRQVYHLSGTVVADAIRRLLATEDVVVEDEGFLTVLFEGKTGPAGDLADHLIARLAERAGCRATVTFDRTAARRVSGMELLA